MGVRIFDDNYSDLATITGSSEQAAFPLTNAFNAQRRSRVWRSDGYWNITSSNNTIIFRESVGVDLTATIATGEYTSTSSFYAAIKAAFEAAGARTYTISQDSTTLKTVIANDGGSAVLELYWSNVLTTMGELLGYDTGSDDTGSFTYTADALVIHTSEWIQWDFGLSSNPKAFALIGIRNASLQISPSATLTLSGNETDNWSSPSAQINLTYDDEVIYSVNTAGLWGSTGSLRYARLEITDKDNANGYVQIGSLFLGDYFDPTRGRVQFPFAGQYVDRSVTTFSEGGQSFSDIREKTEVFTIQWFGLTISERTDINDIWLKFGTSLPFFIQFDPEANFFSTVNQSIRYVKFQNEPRYDLVSPGVYSCNMVLREEL